MGRDRLKYLCSNSTKTRKQIHDQKMVMERKRGKKRGNDYLADVEQNRTVNTIYAQESLSVKFTSKFCPQYWKKKKYPQQQFPIILEYCQQIRKPMMVKPFNSRSAQNPKQRYSIHSGQLLFFKALGIRPSVMTKL